MLWRSCCFILGMQLDSRREHTNGPIPAFKSVVRSCNSFVGAVETARDQNNHKEHPYGPCPPHVYPDLSIHFLFAGERFISNIDTWMRPPWPSMQSFTLPT